jgi:hypothetical protein
LTFRPFGIIHSFDNFDVAQYIQAPFDYAHGGLRTGVVSFEFLVLSFELWYGFAMDFFSGSRIKSGMTEESTCMSILRLTERLFGVISYLQIEDHFR